MALQDPLRDAELLLRSRHPLLLIPSEDRSRVGTLVELLADRMGLPLFRWSRARGLMRLDREGAIYETRELERALRHIAAADQGALYLLEGIEAELPGSSLLQAKFREALDRLETLGAGILLVGEGIELPPGLRSRLAPVELPAPGREELRELLARIVRDLQGRQQVDVALTRTEFDRLLGQLQGLTLMEAEKLLTRAILEDGRLTADDLAVISNHKRRIIEREGVLEYTPANYELAEVADLAGLKGWLRRRTALVRDPEGARAFGLEFPKGLLLTGVPGCGKSLCARAVATEWSLPLLRLDPAGLYNRYIGETERNLERALRLAGRMAPVVLWIDEIEKAFAQGGNEDGGVSRRILGRFLNWLQERREPVFVLATANQVDQLPPELLRKGRFDEVFFVDLPGTEARTEILRIHLARRGRDPASIDAARVAAATEGFSGAELEQVVVSGLHAAFAGGKPFDTELLLAEAAATRPLSVTAREQIQSLRAWSRDRTVPAN